MAERHKRKQATGNRLGLKDHRKEMILLQSPAAGEQCLPLEESPSGEESKKLMEFVQL